MPLPAELSRRPEPPVSHSVYQVQSFVPRRRHLETSAGTQYPRIQLSRCDRDLNTGNQAAEGRCPASGTDKNDIDLLLCGETYKI